MMRNGWSFKTIGDVTKIINGGTPKTKIKEYWGGDIAWITPADLGKLSSIYVENTSRTITDEGLDKSSAKLFPWNSVILSTRAPIGYLAINMIPMATNQGCRGIVPNDNILTKYLYFYLLTNVTLLNNLGTGTTFKELSTKALASVDIPIPPLEEQKEIVEKLDKAFEAIDKAKANIEKNIANAKELFQSKLNEIFSNRGDGWVEKSLGEITTKIGDGLHGTPKYDETGTCYFINGNNLNDGTIEIKSDTKSVSDEEYNKHKKELTNNTVLISINGTLGKVAFYNKEKIILGKSACYLNLNSDVNKYYIKHLVGSVLFFKNMIKESTGATIKNFSLKSMRGYKLFLPPIKIQNNLVNELNIFEKKKNSVEAFYIKKLKNLEELKKSILQKAFRGELTQKN